MNRLGEGTERPAADAAAAERQRGGGPGLVAKTASGLLWMFSGSGMHALFRMGVTIVLARLLTPDIFGVVGAAMAFLGLSQLFSAVGLGPALVQRPEVGERELRTAFTIALLSGVAFGALLALAAPYIAAYFHDERLVPITRVLALGFPISALGVVPDGMLQREMRFAWLAASDVISYALGYGAVGVTLALLGAGAWSLVLASLAQTVALTVILLLASPHPLRPLLDRRAARELLDYGGGYTLARAFNYVALNGDNVVVGRFLGVAALGIYSRSFQLLTLPVNVVANVVEQVLFPLMARVRHDDQLLRSTFRQAVVLVALLFLPWSALLFIAAPEVVLVLFGAEWLEMVPPLRAFALFMLFRAGYKVGDSLAYSSGARVVYRRVKYQVVYAALVLLGAGVGQLWGLSGVAVGVGIAIAVNWVLMMQLSVSIVDTGWRDLLLLHVPAVLIAALVCAVAALTAAQLRGAAPALVVLAVSTTLALAVQGAAALWFDRLVGRRSTLGLAPLLPLLRAARAGRAGAGAEG